MYFVNGKDSKQLNGVIQKIGWVPVLERKFNSPYWPEKTIDSDKFKKRVLVAVFTHLTTAGYYWITHFAYLEDNKFTPANLNELQLKKLDQQAIFQPAFRHLP